MVLSICIDGTEITSFHAGIIPPSGFILSHEKNELAFSWSGGKDSASCALLFVK